MPKSSAVLFDLDGTILDTADDLGLALNYVLRTCGLSEISPEQYRPVASHGSRGLLNLGFGDRIQEFDFETLKTQFLEFYLQNISVETCYMPFAETTLLTLNELGVPWGIVTNKPQFLTEQLVTHFPLLQYCGVVVSGDTLPKAKPDPGLVNWAMGRLNVLPQNTLYIGDAERDIEAGRRAFMKTAVVLNGYIREEDTPMKWNADLILEDLSKLTDHLA